MHGYVLGLGSNVGESLNFIRKALREIELKNISVLKVSPIYRSRAMLPEGAPISWDMDFLNLVCSVETKLAPGELLSVVKQIEKSVGRKPSERWAPREIDIDIYLWSGGNFRSDSVEIPHPQIDKRPFVLMPLLDLVASESKGSWGAGDVNLELLNLGESWQSLDSKSVPFETQKTPLSLTELIGILNVTPDSFSDGGKFFHIEESLRQFRNLLNEGASIVDIGGESTRPGAQAISPTEEWNRIGILLEELCRLKLLKFVSVDTYHPETAERCLELGVPIINDVGGLDKKAMRDLFKGSEARVIFMHNLGLPARKDLVLLDGIPAAAQVLDWAKKKIEICVGEGLSLKNLIFDPGIGFGKTASQSLQLLQNIETFRELRVPIYVGHSRKSFMNLVTEKPFSERDLETGAISAELAQKGVEFLRVHNIDLNKRQISAKSLYDGVVFRRNSLRSYE